MSSFAILRTQKLKTNSAIRGSLKHAFREQETQNADDARTPENTHLKAENSEQAMQNIQGLLPDKIRKNGVRVIEYLMTASPEALNSKSREEQNAYFSDAKKWLEERHGAENVAYLGVHRDEKTPHMYAYVVPIDEKGKLNARAFLGGSKHVMSELQTDFSEKVGERHGLTRGVKNSKGKHQTLKAFYSKTNDLDSLKVAIRPSDLESKVTKKSFLFTEKESPAQIARRIEREVDAKFKPLVALATKAHDKVIRLKHLEEIMPTQQKEVSAVRDAFKSLTKKQTSEVLNMAFDMQNANNKASQEALQRRQEQQKPSRGMER